MIQSSFWNQNISYQTTKTSRYYDFPLFSILSMLFCFINFLSIFYEILFLKFFIFSLLFFSYFSIHFSTSVGFFLVSIFQLRIVGVWVYLLLISILGMVSHTPVNDDIMTLLIFPLCFDQDLLTSVWTVVYFWILNLSFPF